MQTCPGPRPGMSPDRARVTNSPPGATRRSTTANWATSLGSRIRRRPAVPSWSSAAGSMCGVSREGSARRRPGTCTARRFVDGLDQVGGRAGAAGDRRQPGPAGERSIRPAAHGARHWLVDARVVARTIEQVADGPVHLVGNSGGGVVDPGGRAVAAPGALADRARPGRTRPAADHRPRGRSEAGPACAWTAGPAYRRLRSIPPMLRARGTGELCFGRPEMITDRDYALAAREHAWRADLPWAYVSTVGTLRGLMSWYLRRGHQSFGAVAGRVRVPTLVVWGTRDRLVDVRLSRRGGYSTGSRLLVPGRARAAVGGAGIDRPGGGGPLARRREHGRSRTPPGRARIAEERPRAVVITPGAPPRPASTPMATS